MIMSRHYGAPEVDALLNKCKLSIPNLSLYLELTGKQGKHETAVNEILECYKGKDASSESCEPKCVSDQEQKSAEDFLSWSSDYLYGMECNTTLSCCLETGTVDPNPEEEDSVEEADGDSFEETDDDSVEETDDEEPYDEEADGDSVEKLKTEYDCDREEEFEVY